MKTFMRAAQQGGVIPTDVLSLYEQHKSMVYRLAFSYTKSRSDAEDICQAVFLRLIEKRGSIQDGKEKAWLASVTVNQCRDLLRSAWRRKTEPLTEDMTFETPEQTELYEALLTLKEHERAAVYLHYFEGYSVAEIAKLLGVTQSAVTSRLGRAREHLRNKLEDTV